MIQRIKTFVDKYFWDILSLSIISIIILASVRTIFSEGYLIYSDHPYHYYNAWIFAKSKSLFPWDTNFGFGWVYLALNPLIYYLTYIFSLPGIDLNTSYKLVVVLTYILISISIYFLIRVFGISYLTAFIVTLLAILPYEYENSINGIYTNIVYVGQIAWIISIAFTFFAFGFYKLYLTNKKTRFIILCIISVSLSLLSSISFYIVPILLFFLYSLIFIDADIPKRIKLSIKYTSFIIFTSSILVGFWIINLIHAIINDFPDNASLGYMFDLVPSVQFSYIRYMFFWPLLFIIPIVVVLYDKKDNLFKFTILMIFSSLFFIFLSLGTSIHNFLSSIIFGYDKFYFARFLIYGKLFSILTISPILDFLLKNFRKFRLLKKLMIISIFSICLQLILVGLTYTDIDYPWYDDKKDIKTSKDFILTKDIDQIKKHINVTINKGDRFYVQDTFGSLKGFQHFNIPLKYKYKYDNFIYPYFSHNIFNYPIIAENDGFYLGSYALTNYVYSIDIFSDFNKIFGYDVSSVRQEWVDDVLYNKSLELGITNYIILNDNLKKYLDRSKKFIKINSSGIFSLYEVGERPKPISIENGSIEYLDISPNKIIIITTNNYNASITLKLKYRDDLRVYDNDNNELKIEPLYNGEYIFIKIYPYDSSRDIYIEKNSNKLYLGLLISFLGTIIIWRVDYEKLFE